MLSIIVSRGIHRESVSKKEFHVKTKNFNKSMSKCKKYAMWLKYNGFSQQSFPQFPAKSVFSARRAKKIHYAEIDRGVILMKRLGGFSFFISHFSFFYESSFFFSEIQLHGHRCRRVSSCVYLDGNKTNPAQQRQ